MKKKYKSLAAESFEHFVWLLEMAKRDAERGHKDKAVWQLDMIIESAKKRIEIFEELETDKEIA